MAQPLDEGSLVTGRLSHEIFVIRAGVRCWVPDSWTMQAEGLSPADLQIVGDEALGAIDSGEPLACAIPAPKLAEDTVVETEHGVFRVCEGHLEKVVDPRLLVLDDLFEPDQVVFLPASLVRGLYADGEVGQ